MEEDTRTVMTALRNVIVSKGWFCALYSDRTGHFFHTPKAQQQVDRRQLTPVGRAMKDLNIQPPTTQMIPTTRPSTA